MLLTKVRYFLKTCPMRLKTFFLLGLVCLACSPSRETGHFALSEEQTCDLRGFWENSQAAQTYYLQIDSAQIAFYVAPIPTPYLYEFSIEQNRLLCKDTAEQYFEMIVFDVNKDTLLLVDNQIDTMIFVRSTYWPF